MSKAKQPKWQKRRQIDHSPFVVAGQEQLPYLYRYHGFQLESHRPDRPSDPEILIDILKNGRVYCSNPLNFNDPWDCKPHINLDVLEDPKIRLDTARFLIDHQLGGPKGDLTDLVLLSSLPALRRLPAHLLIRWPLSLRNGGRSVAYLPTPAQL